MTTREKHRSPARRLLPRSSSGRDRVTPVWRRFSLLLGTALIAFTTSCSVLDRREQDLFEKSRTALAAGDRHTALAGASNLLEAHPGYLPARLLRGEALFALGRHEEALKDLERTAHAGDELDDDDLFAVHYYSGRALLELGRGLVPDAQLRRLDVDPESLRKARDRFVAANRELVNALKVKPDDYDAVLWRGYSFLRLENHRKATDVLKRCAELDPARWEHRFLGALALEGLYRTNTQSLTAYLEIAASGPQAEMAPVIEHLASLYQEVPPANAQQILVHAASFTAAFPGRSPAIDSFVARAQARIEEERRRSRLEALTTQVQSLLADNQIQPAIDAIDQFMREESDAKDIQPRLQEAKERWSLLLESRGEGMTNAESKATLELALSTYEWARKLTTQVDRLVVLQQKINAVQLAIARRATSRKLQETYQILKARKYEAVLRELAGTSIESLSERDRDLYHYLRGVAAYNLGQWGSAATSFQSITRRDFENLDALHGLALVKAGQETAGIALLAALPVEARNDDVNRLLGRHFVAQKDHRKAAGYLSAIKSPQPADSEAHYQARRDLGLEFYARGEYEQAVTELQAACHVVETQLGGKRPETYLHLGNAYYHMDDMEKARKVYQDLSDSGLTANERKACRDLFLYRGQIFLRDKQPDRSYRDFVEFRALGGQLPEALSTTYGRLVATYGDFVPLEKVGYWTYVSTTLDYNYTLQVNRQENGAHVMVRREGGNQVSEEKWWRQGIYLTREVGETVYKLPVNLHPAEAALPVIEYTSRGMQCTSEVVEIDQTVEVSGKGAFQHCLKVRMVQKSYASDGSAHTTKHIFYFAPDVGEVKQEIYRDNIKVSEIVLSDHSAREAAPGR